MLDILFAVGQFLSVMGLIYGLFLTLARRECDDELRSEYDRVTGQGGLAQRAARGLDARRRRALRPHPSGPARFASRAALGR